MAYDPAEPEPKDKVQRRVTDTGAAVLLRGGDSRYEEILARYAVAGTSVIVDGEVMDLGEARATLEAARALAGELAQLPDSVSIAGQVSVSWRSRVDQINAIAARFAVVVAASAGTAALSF